MSMLTVAIWEADDPYRYAEVRGQVVDIVAGPEARAHIDELSMKYYGHEYRNQIQSERLLLRIKPLRQRLRVSPRIVQRAISKYNARGPHITRTSYKATVSIDIPTRLPP